jgi:hypothetical protein
MPWLRNVILSLQDAGWASYPVWMDVEMRNSLAPIEV